MHSFVRFQSYFIILVITKLDDSTFFSSPQLVSDISPNRCRTISHKAPFAKIVGPTIKIVQQFHRIMRLIIRKASFLREERGNLQPERRLLLIAGESLRARHSPRQRATLPSARHRRQIRARSRHYPRPRHECAPDPNAPLCCNHADLRKQAFPSNQPERRTANAAALRHHRSYAHW